MIHAFNVLLLKCSRLRNLRRTFFSRRKNRLIPLNKPFLDKSCHKINTSTTDCFCLILFTLITISNFYKLSFKKNASLFYQISYSYYYLLNAFMCAIMTRSIASTKYIHCLDKLSHKQWSRCRPIKQSIYFGHEKHLVLALTFSQLIF